MFAFSNRPANRAKMPAKAPLITPTPFDGRPAGGFGGLQSNVTVCRASKKGVQTA